VDELLDSGRANDFVELIEQAVDWGRSHKCRVVGLGGRTSGATLNGTTCGAPDIVVTTGNAYTAALAMQGIREAAEAAGLRLERVTGGVVGAAGNIGSVCARMLAKQCARIVLFGHRRVDQRRQRLAAELYREALDELAKGGPLSGIARTIAALPELDRCLATHEGAGEEDATWLYDAFLRHYGSAAPVSICTELHEVRRCQAVVSATAVGGAVLKPEHFSNETTVVCDVSTPPDVSKEVPRERPNVTVYRAGNATLRSGRGVRLIGSALPEDHLPGCVSETIALAFSSDARRLASIGDLRLAQVEEISRLAQEIGFELGQSKSLEP